MIDADAQTSELPSSTRKLNEAIESGDDTKAQDILENKQLKENIESINVELSSEIINEINLVHKNNPNPAP